MHLPLRTHTQTHTHTLALALACAHTSQDDSYNCRDHKFTKSPVERWRTRGDGLGIRSARHSRAKVSSPLCPTRQGPSPRLGPRAPCPHEGDEGSRGKEMPKQGRLLSELLEELILVGEAGAGGGRSHGGGSERCDGRHANRRGFPGLAPPRCHPGGRPHFPGPKVARRRGSARRGGARGARWPDQPAPRSLLLSSSRRGGQAEGSRRGGEVTGGAVAVTRAARAESSTQRPGWRAAVAESCGQRRRWWPALLPYGGRKAGNPRGDRVRSLGSGEAGSRGSSPAAPPPASPRPAKPPPRRPHTSL